MGQDQSSPKKDETNGSTSSPKIDVSASRKSIQANQAARAASAFLGSTGNDDATMNSLNNSQHNNVKMTTPVKQQKYKEDIDSDDDDDEDDDDNSRYDDYAVGQFYENGDRGNNNNNNNNVGFMSPAMSDITAGDVQTPPVCWGDERSMISNNTPLRNTNNTERMRDNTGRFFSVTQANNNNNNNNNDPNDTKRRSNSPSRYGSTTISSNYSYDDSGDNHTAASSVGNRSTSGGSSLEHKSSVVLSPQFTRRSGGSVMHHYNESGDRSSSYTTSSISRYSRRSSSSKSRSKSTSKDDVSVGSTSWKSVGSSRRSSHNGAHSTTKSPVHLPTPNNNNNTNYNNNYTQHQHQEGGVEDELLRAANTMAVMTGFMSRPKRDSLQKQNEQIIQKIEDDDVVPMHRKSTAFQSPTSNLADVSGDSALDHFRKLKEQVEANERRVAEEEANEDVLKLDQMLEVLGASAQDDHHPNPDHNPNHNSAASNIKPTSAATNHHSYTAQSSSLAKTNTNTAGSGTFHKDTNKWMVDINAIFSEQHEQEQEQKSSPKKHKNRKNSSKQSNSNSSSSGAAAAPITGSFLFASHAQFHAPPKPGPAVTSSSLLEDGCGEQQLDHRVSRYTKGLPDELHVAAAPSNNRYADNNNPTTTTTTTTTEQELQTGDYHIKRRSVAFNTNAAVKSMSMSIAANANANASPHRKPGNSILKSPKYSGIAANNNTDNNTDNTPPPGMPNLDRRQSLRNTWADVETTKVGGGNNDKEMSERYYEADGNGNGSTSKNSKKKKKGLMQRMRQSIKGSSNNNGGGENNTNTNDGRASVGAASPGHDLYQRPSRRYTQTIMTFENPAANNEDGRTNCNLLRSNGDVPRPLLRLSFPDEQPKKASMSSSYFTFAAYALSNKAPAQDLVPNIQTMNGGILDDFSVAQTAISTLTMHHPDDYDEDGMFAVQPALTISPQERGAVALMSFALKKSCKQALEQWKARVAAAAVDVSNEES